MEKIGVATQARCQLVDITAKVQEAVRSAGVEAGAVMVFIPHTTAGVTINENADPDVCHDLLEKLARLIPRDEAFYRHGEGNSDAHLKASLVGSSVRVIVEGGRLQLGTWQSIYLAEFDGPRRREAWVNVEMCPGA
jgi:secondary thiamine-phosphate synthase enzyme